jgi:hypothetical protein
MSLLLLLLLCGIAYYFVVCNGVEMDRYHIMAIILNGVIIGVITVFLLFADKLLPLLLLVLSWVLLPLGMYCICF